MDAVRDGRRRDDQDEKRRAQGGSAPVATKSGSAPSPLPCPSLWVTDSHQQLLSSVGNRRSRMCGGRRTAANAAGPVSPNSVENSSSATLRNQPGARYAMVIAVVAAFLPRLRSGSELTRSARGRQVGGRCDARYPAWRCSGLLAGPKNSVPGSAANSKGLDVPGLRATCINAGHDSAKVRLWAR